MGYDMDMSSEDIFREFKAMRIKHPHHDGAVTAFEKLRKRKDAAPDAEQTTASLFAGSQSGKSTTVRWYIEKDIVDECIKLGTLKDDRSRFVLGRLQNLALHVELSGSTTVSSLMSDFLEALRDPDPHTGTTRQRRYRVEKALETRGYQIIFLDETQHIKTKTYTGPVSRKEDATEVQNTLKNWVKKWPIVFIGTQHAENVVFEHQVYTRSDTPIEFGPLHFGKEKDAGRFIDFCGRLSLKILQHGILRERPDILITDDVPLCLNIASKGRLGLVTVIVRKALELGCESGERVLTRRLLEAAVQDFTLRIGICAYNPFTEGPIVLPSAEEYAGDS